MTRGPTFLLLLLSHLLLGKLAQTNAIVLGKAEFTPVIAEKNNWYVLFTTSQNAFVGENGRVHCGGALVAQDMVLTAAHCFDKYIAGKETSLSRYTAWVGRQAMCATKGDVGRAYALEGVYYDGRYDVDDDRNLHDYALVKIVEFGPSVCDRGALGDNTAFATYGESTTIRSTEFVTDSSGLFRGYESGDMLDLYGFGRMYYIGIVGPTSPLLLRANATRWNDLVCEIAYEGDDFTSRSEFQFCVWPALTCFGDSGGALVLGDDVVGIASFLINDEGLPLVGLCFSEFEFYTKIEVYKDDISAVICDVSVSPPTRLNCPTARIQDEEVSTKMDLAAPSPTTPQSMARTALTTMTRAGRFFWGDWFS